MKSKHRLQQPRPILESKILKHTKNLSYTELVRKYSFLVRKYKILEHLNIFNYKTWIHTIIKQSLTDLYNYKTVFNRFVHLYELLYLIICTII